MHSPLTMCLPSTIFVRAACDFAEPTCVIVKHTNPCGVASRDDLLEAYRLAVIADPISAFGGIVAFNRWVDGNIVRCLLYTICAWGGIAAFNRWVRSALGGHWDAAGP